MESEAMPTPARLVPTRQRELFHSLARCGEPVLTVGPEGIRANLVETVTVRRHGVEDTLDVDDGLHHVHVDRRPVKGAEVGSDEGEGLISFYDGIERAPERVHPPNPACCDVRRRHRGGGDLPHPSRTVGGGRPPCGHRRRHARRRGAPVGPALDSRAVDGKTTKGWLAALARAKPASVDEATYVPIDGKKPPSADACEPFALGDPGGRARRGRAWGDVAAEVGTLITQRDDAGIVAVNPR
jgi:hypothetical protein